MLLPRNHRRQLASHLFLLPIFITNMYFIKTITYFDWILIGNTFLMAPHHGLYLTLSIPFCL